MVNRTPNVRGTRVRSIAHPLRFALPASLGFLSAPYVAFETRSTAISARTLAELRPLL